MQFNNVTETLKAHPEFKPFLGGSIVTQFCYSIGLEFDSIFVPNEPIEKYGINITNIIFLEPLIEKKSQIKSGSFRVMYDFVRFIGDKPISQTVLNVIISVKNGDYKSMDGWIPGESLLNVFEFNEISDNLQSSVQTLFETEYGKNNQKIEFSIYSTELIEYKHEDYWIESWCFFDLKTKNKINTKFKFTQNGDNLSYEIIN
jgi:hypothetical protein